MLVSSGDLHIDTYKPASKCAYYTANNHGSMVEIGGEWYIFYHRHTNGTNYSRQGCFERLSFAEDGSVIPILYGCYNVYSKRGQLLDLQPARDNVFYYTIGKTMDDILEQSSES